jgi:hypothetical protein
MQLWGDTTQKLYGMDIRLVERFWGDPCPYLPDGIDGTEPYPIPMAGACLFAVSRAQIEDFGLYDKNFGPYGGGEPYLCLKWWMYGSSVIMEPRGLVRHAFGLKPTWKPVRRERTSRNEVYLKTGKITRNLKPGDEYLSYSAGYAVGNEELYTNFMLAAFLVGGEEWLNVAGESFAKKVRDQEMIPRIKSNVMRMASKDREEIKSKTRIGLNALLCNPPWKSCSRHNLRLPDFLTVQEEARGAV